MIKLLQSSSSYLKGSKRLWCLTQTRRNSKTSSTTINFCVIICIYMSTTKNWWVVVNLDFWRLDTGLKIFRQTSDSISLLAGLRWSAIFFGKIEVDIFDYGCTVSHGLGCGIYPLGSSYKHFNEKFVGSSSQIEQLMGSMVHINIMTECKVDLAPKTRWYRP